MFVVIESQHDIDWSYSSAVVASTDKTKCEAYVEEENRKQREESDRLEPYRDWYRNVSNKIYGLQVLNDYDNYVKKDNSLVKEREDEMEILRKALRNGRKKKLKECGVKPKNYDDYTDDGFSRSPSSSFEVVEVDEL